MPSISISIQRAKPKTAGGKWFNMAATEMTPEVKRDLQILNMRNFIDPKRHYKKSSSKDLPKFFQVLFFQLVYPPAPRSA